MSQQRLSVYSILVVSLFYRAHLSATYVPTVHVVVHMPTVYILMREQPAVHRPLLQQVNSDEYVIEIDRLSYATNESRYVMQTPTSRVQVVHNFVNKFKHSFCPWWFKEKMD